MTGLFGACCGFICLVVVRLLSLLSIGGGHGSYSPWFSMVSYRLENLTSVLAGFERPAGLALWPVVGFLIGLRRWRWVRLAGGLGLIASVLSVIYHAAQTPADLTGGVKLAWNPFSVGAYALYLAGQLSGWYFLLRRNRRLD